MITLGSNFAKYFPAASAQMRKEAIENAAPVTPPRRPIQDPDFLYLYCDSIDCRNGTFLLHIPFSQRYYWVSCPRGAATELADAAGWWPTRPGQNFFKDGLGAGLSIPREPVLAWFEKYNPELLPVVEAA